MRWGSETQEVSEERTEAHGERTERDLHEKEEVTGKAFSLSLDSLHRRGSYNLAMHGDYWWPRRPAWRNTPVE